MSVKAVYLILLLGLSGCASEVASTFTPYTPETKNSDQFVADLSVCRGYALDYLQEQNSLDPGTVASAGAEGLLGDLGSAAVSPYAPPAQGAGAASSEALEEEGLDVKGVRHLIAQCMHDKGQASGAYNTWDPNG